MYTDLFFIGLLLSLCFLLTGFISVAAFGYCFVVEKILLSWGVNNNKLVTKIFFRHDSFIFLHIYSFEQGTTSFFNCLGKILISGVCLFVFVWNLLFSLFFSDFQYTTMLRCCLVASSFIISVRFVYMTQLGIRFFLFLWWENTLYFLLDILVFRQKQTVALFLRYYSSL